MTDPLENFAIFLTQCNKVYNDQGEYKSGSLDLLITFHPAEEDQRRGIFDANLDLIYAAQARYDSGQTTYDLRINCFGDLSFEEFASTRLGGGTLAGNLDRDLDPNIVPVTERIVTSRCVIAAVLYFSLDLI